MKKKEIPKQTFAQKLKQLGLGDETSQQTYLQSFIQPQSLFSSFRDVANRLQKNVQIDDTYYQSILQEFMKSNQLFQFKEAEIFQAWIIIKIKEKFNLNVCISKIKQIVKKEIHQKINIEVCVQKIAKLDESIAINFAEWIKVNKEKMEQFNQMVKDSQYFKAYAVLINKTQASHHFYLNELKQQGKLIKLQYDQLLKYENLLQLQIQKHIYLSFFKIYEGTKNHSEEQYQSMKKIISCIKLKSISDIASQLKKQKRQISQSAFQKLLTLENNSSIDQLTKYKQIYSIWVSIKQQLNILNVFLLRQLIKNTTQSKKHIEGKNILLLIGPSGAGKTTIILRLLNYQLEQATINQLPTLVPKIALKPEHSQLITSPLAKSTTKYIFSAQISPQYVAEKQPKGEGGEKVFIQEQLYLCDTPGFLDTSGVVVDIANGVGMINAVKLAKTIKPIVVISALMVGEKFQGIKEIGKIVSNLFNVYRKKHEGSSTSFIFNKYGCKKQNKQFNRLLPGLLSILNNLSAAERSDKSYVEFLQTLYLRLQKNEDLMMFDPFNIDLKKTIKQISGNPIQKPSFAFKYSFSTRSSLALKNYYEIKQNIVMNLLYEDLNHACYHINEMKSLLELVPNEDSKNQFENLINNICRMNQLSFKRFKQIRDQVIMIQASKFQIQDMKDIYNKLKMFNAFDKIPQMFQIFRQKDLLNVIKKIPNELQKKYKSYDFTNNNQSQFKKTIQIINFFCQKFPPHQHQTGILVNNFKNYISINYSETKFKIDQKIALNEFNNEFKQLHEQLQNICTYFQLLTRQKPQRSQKMLDIKYQQIKRQVDPALAVLQQILKNSNQQRKDFNKLILLLQQKYTILQNIMSLNIHKKIQQQNLKKSISDKIKALLKEISSRCEQIVVSNDLKQSNIIILRKNLEYLRQAGKFTKFKDQCQFFTSNIHSLIKREYQSQIAALEKIIRYLTQDKKIGPLFFRLDQILFKIRNYTLENSSDQEKSKEIQNTFILQFGNFFKNISNISKINVSIKTTFKQNEVVNLVNTFEQLKKINNIKQQSIKSELGKIQYLKKSILQKIKFPYKQIEKFFVSQYGQMKINKRKLEQLKVFIDYDVYIKRGIDNKYYQREILPDKRNNYGQNINKLMDQLKKSIKRQLQLIYSKQNRIYHGTQEQLSTLKKVISLFSYVLKDKVIFSEVKQQMKNQFCILYGQFVRLLQINQQKLLQQFQSSRRTQNFQNTVRKIKKICSQLTQFDSQLDQESNFSFIMKNIDKQCFQNESDKINKLFIIFNKSCIDYQQLKAFYQKNKQNKQLVKQMMDQLRKYEQQLFKKIQSMRKYSQDLFFQEENINYIKLIKQAYEFYSQPQEIFPTQKSNLASFINLQYIQKSLKLFVQNYQLLYQKIMKEICELRYKTIPKKINSYLQDLEKLISTLFPQQYESVKKKIFKDEFCQDLKVDCPPENNKSIAYHISKFNKILNQSLENDLSKVIDIFSQHSIKYYKNLSKELKSQYEKCLKRQFIKQLEIYQAKAKVGKENQQRLLQFLLLVPSQCKKYFQGQLLEMKSKIQEERGHLLTRFLKEAKCNNFQDSIKIYKQMNCSYQKNHKKQLLNVMDIFFLSINQKQSTQKKLQCYIQMFPKYDNDSVLKNHLLLEYQNNKKKLENQIMSQIQDLIRKNKQNLQSVKVGSINELLQSNKTLTQAYVLCIERNLKVFQKLLQMTQDYFLFLISQFEDLSKMNNQIQFSQFDNLQKYIKRSHLLKFVIQPITNEITDNRNKIIQYRNNQAIVNGILKDKGIDQSRERIATYILQVHLQIKGISFPNDIIYYRNSLRNAEQESRIFLQDINQKIVFLSKVGSIYNQYGLDKLQVVNNTSKIADLSPFYQTVQKQLKEAFSQIQKLKIHPENKLSLRFNIILKFCQFWEDNNQHKEIHSFMNKIKNGLGKYMRQMVDRFQRQILSFIDSLKKKEHNNSLKFYKQQPQLECIQHQHNIEKIQPFINYFIIMEKMQTIITLSRQRAYLQNRFSQMIALIGKHNYLLSIIRGEMQYKLSTIPQIVNIAKKNVTLQSILQVQSYFGPTKNQKVFFSQLKSKNQNIDSDYLYDQYQKFQENYDKNLLVFKKDPSKMTIQNISRNAQNQVTKHETCLAIGSIYALYAILKRNNLNEINFRPNPGQFVCISLLLQQSQIPTIKKIKKTIIQMLPGEGKSNALAITACYLALKQYKVHQICYTDYLAKRDQSQFRQLFETLKIKDRITITVFSQFCQSFVFPGSSKKIIQNSLSNQITISNKNFRDQLQTNFNQSCYQFQTEQSRNIVLFDEIDILFLDEFEGQVFEPTFYIGDQGYFHEITNIFQQIWEKSKDQYLTISFIEKADSYKKLLKKYKQIQNIMKSQVIRMLNDVLDHQKINDYYQHIKDKKEGEIDVNTDFEGYQQSFAYVKLKQQNLISQQALKNKLKIYIKVGKFSYYGLAKRFSKIIGVSGSLEEKDKQILREQYSIENIYNLPSVLRESRLFQEEKIIPTQSKRQFYKEIVSEINSHFFKRQSSNSMIVFFKNKRDIEYFDQILSQQRFLYQQNKVVQINYLFDYNSINIGRVGTAHCLTLATKSFSRGINYNYFDQTNGLFVIQTYLPLNIQQLSYAKGRTARKGRPGTFKLIISEEELKKKNIQKISRQQGLNWQKIMQKTYQTRKKNRDQAQKRHLKMLKQYEKGPSIQYFQKINYVQTQVLPNQLLFVFGFQGNLQQIQDYKQQLIMQLQNYQRCLRKNEIYKTLKYIVCLYGHYTNYSDYTDYTNYTNYKKADALQSIFKTTKMCEFDDLKKQIKKIKLQKTNQINKQTVSIQLFLKYICDLSKNRKINLCFIWNYAKDYAWKDFSKTNQFKRCEQRIRAELGLQNENMKSYKRCFETLKQNKVPLNFIDLSKQSNSGRMAQQFTRLYGHSQYLNTQMRNNKTLREFISDKIKQVIPQLKNLHKS